MARRLVLDASTIVAALLPDEPLHAAAVKWMERYAAGDLDILAPTLLPYELASSLLTAERRASRLSAEDVDAILTDLEYLGIELLPVSPTLAVAAARRYRCSPYDASYIALAEQRKVHVVTTDRSLMASVGPHCACLRWVEVDDV